MPLTNFKSLCKLHAAIVVSRDTGNTREHRALTGGCAVTQYRIDGVVLTAGNKCDFLVMNEDKMTVYLVSAEKFSYS